MLTNREYLGHIIVNKHSPRSFKDKSLQKLPKEAWIEVKNTHEPIIDEDVFNTVQSITSVKRKKVKRTQTPQMFVGLLRCPKCGKTLSFSRRVDRNSFGFYSCTTYRSFGKSYCSMHYITYENLYNAVLTDIKKHIDMASINHQKLLSQITAKTNIDHENKIKKQQRKFIILNRKIGEIDELIKNIYEDYVKGKLSEKRFVSMSKAYEEEQESILEQIEQLRSEIANYKNHKDDSKQFIKIIQKNTNIKTLNASILNELIQKICVHEAGYEQGERKQQIDIYYKFVGMI